MKPMMQTMDLTIGIKAGHTQLVITANDDELARLVKVVIGVLWGMLCWQMIKGCRLALDGLVGWIDQVPSWWHQIGRIVSDGLALGLANLALAEGRMKEVMI